MACKNNTCKWNDPHAANGCKLFPGTSWLRCRGASVTAKQTKTKKKETT